MCIKFFHSHEETRKMCKFLAHLCFLFFAFLKTVQTRSKLFIQGHLAAAQENILHFLGDGITQAWMRLIIQRFKRERKRKSHKNARKTTTKMGRLNERVVQVMLAPSLLQGRKGQKQGKYAEWRKTRVYLFWRCLRP